MSRSDNGVSERNAYEIIQSEGLVGRKMMINAKVLPMSRTQINLFYMVNSLALKLNVSFVI